MKENDFITITNIKEYIDRDDKNRWSAVLKKEPNNAYDMESIMVENKNEIPIGRNNSVSSVAKGTHSAGYIYQSFNDSILYGKNLFIMIRLLLLTTLITEETKTCN